MEDILSLFPITNPFFFSNMEKRDYQVVLAFVNIQLYRVALFRSIFAQHQNPEQSVSFCEACERVVIEQDDSNNLVSILRMMNTVDYGKDVSDL